MASHNKIKVSSYKNKRGQTVSVARVYSKDGNLLSEHESVGSNAQAAASAAMSKMKEDYRDLSGTEYDISNATIEHVPSKKPISESNSPQENKQTSEGYPIEIEVEESEEFNPPPIEYGPPITEEERKLLEQINSTPITQFEKIINGPKHRDWPDFDSGIADGKGHKSLKEPVPSYFSRPGDGILTAEGMFSEGGVNNNAWIVLGRDRNGIGEFNTKTLKRSQSGHSDKMAAGAIDIVVGRMAPFPLSGYSLSPTFKTKEVLELKANQLQGTRPDGYTTNHPGFIMDAARIYISQMTDIDHNFDITRRLTEISDTETKVASSGIMLKADRLRMHARNDIKIVTGGSKERYTSMGATNDSFGGIHLIAGNGDLGVQHPIPRGRNLLLAFEELLKHHNEFVDLVFNFVDTQMKYNQILATHFHQSPVMGSSTTPSITGWAMGVESSVTHFVNFAVEIPKHKYNSEQFKKRFLTSSEDDYINSRYNTTN